MAAGCNCNVSWQTARHVKRLEDCPKQWPRNTNDPKLVIYQWGIAMKKETTSARRTARERAQALRPAGIDMMER